MESLVIAAIIFKVGQAVYATVRMRKTKPMRRIGFKMDDE